MCDRGLSCIPSGFSGKVLGLEPALPNARPYCRQISPLRTDVAICKQLRHVTIIIIISRLSANSGFELSISVNGVLTVLK